MKTRFALLFGITALTFGLVQADPVVVDIAAPGIRYVAPAPILVAQAPAKGDDAPAAKRAAPVKDDGAAVVTVPERVAVKSGRMARIVATVVGGTDVKYVNVYDADLFREYVPNQFVFRFQAFQDGEYKLGFYSASGGVPSDAAYCTVVVGTPRPTPPPGPTPTPTPTPTPVPAPGLIAGDGLKVLLVYETGADGTPALTHSRIVYNGKIRDYLNSKCPVGPDGKTKEWRFWDQNTATDNESKTWQDAMKRSRAGLPWLIVSNPQKPGGGWEGKVSGVEEVMLKIKEFGE